MKTRDMSRALGEIAAASPLFLFAPLYRHWHLRWGATDAEVAAAMPGDELVEHPSFNTTRAITIDAPPEEVWPWLVQIGYGKAGFYSYDLFDNAGRPSAERILPEHQDPAIGDWVPMAAKVNETTAFKIKAFEQTASCSGRSRTAPGRGDWNRARGPYSPGHAAQGPLRLAADPANALLSLILFEFGDFPMMRKLLLGVKRRAEQTSRPSPESPRASVRRSHTRTRCRKSRDAGLLQVQEGVPAGPAGIVPACG